MIEFLQKLIRIQSISPRDEGCFDLIEERLKKLNFSCERINYLNVENLYATYGDRKSTRLNSVTSRSRMPSSA